MSTINKEAVVTALSSAICLAVEQLVQAEVEKQGVGFDPSAVVGLLAEAKDRNEKLAEDLNRAGENVHEDDIAYFVRSANEIFDSIRSIHGDLDSLSDDIGVLSNPDFDTGAISDSLSSNASVGERIGSALELLHEAGNPAPKVVAPLFHEGSGIEDV